MKLRSLKRVVETSIREIVEERKAIARAKLGGNMSSPYGVDLLGLMLSEGENFSVQQIVDECKTFFFAGHETTALLLTWALLLLAHNTRWQEKARLEVVDMCEAKLPDFDSASKMKTVRFLSIKVLDMISINVFYLFVYKLRALNILPHSFCTPMCIVKNNSVSLRDS